MNQYLMVVDLGDRPKPFLMMTSTRWSFLVVHWCPRPVESDPQFPWAEKTPQALAFVAARVALPLVRLWFEVPLVQTPQICYTALALLVILVMVLVLALLRVSCGGFYVC